MCTGLGGYDSGHIWRQTVPSPPIVGRSGKQDVDTAPTLAFSPSNTAILGGGPARPSSPEAWPADLACQLAWSPGARTEPDLRLEMSHSSSLPLWAQHRVLLSAYQILMLGWSYANQTWASIPSPSRPHLPSAPICDSLGPFLALLLLVTIGPCDRVQAVTLLALAGCLLLAAVTHPWTPAPCWSL